MKKILIYILALIFLSVFASTQSIDVIEDEVIIILSQGTIQTSTFEIINNGPTPSTVTISHNIDLTDNDGDEITLLFSDPGEIEPGNTSIVTITAEANKRMDFETYQGNVIITDTNTSETDIFNLILEVQPDVCDFGQVGDDLIIRIEDPDENDEYGPGDEINIKVNVENNGNNDIRTQVEAFLFSDKSQIANAASPSLNVEDGSEEDFRFSLKIPLDSNKIGDEDDDFTLYIKAFDDDEENINCVQGKVAIDIELEKRKLIIDESNTRFLPSSALCGDTVLANIRVVNIGEKDSDQTSIKITNNELSISEQSDTFSVESFTSDEDNDETRQFSIKIPNGIKAKTYYFNVGVDYEGGKTTKQIPLDIVSCETPETRIQQGDILATVIPVESKIYTKQGKIISVPVKVTNNRQVIDNFHISLTNIGEFGTSAPKIITLNPNQQSTVFLDLIIKDDAIPMIHTAVIEVRVQGIVAATETVAIDIQEEQYQESKPFENLYQSIPLTAWIIVDIIVIIVLIITIATIIKNRKH